MKDSGLSLREEPERTNGPRWLAGPMLPVSAGLSGSHVLQPVEITHPVKTQLPLQTLTWAWKSGGWAHADIVFFTLLLRPSSEASPSCARWQLLRKNWLSQVAAEEATVPNRKITVVNVKSTWHVPSVFEKSFWLINLSLWMFQETNSKEKWCIYSMGAYFFKYLKSWWIKITLWPPVLRLWR